MQTGFVRRGRVAPGADKRVQLWACDGRPQHHREPNTGTGSQRTQPGRRLFNVPGVLTHAQEISALYRPALERKDCGRHLHIHHSSEGDTMPVDLTPGVLSVPGRAFRVHENLTT